MQLLITYHNFNTSNEYKQLDINMLQKLSKTYKMSGNVQ